MEKLLTSKELAKAIGASESSMRRWTNSGVIRTARTVGGHRRIAISEAIRFVRQSGATVVRPDLLGLPDAPAAVAASGPNAPALETRLFEALRSGDAATAKGWISGMFLKGMSLASICDGALHEAMQQMGELWQTDTRGILVEHRATGICIQVLEMLRQLIAQPAVDAPVALGGAPAGDPYLLPSMMAAHVLAESGYRDMNYGPETPLELLAAAAAEHKASIVWLSVKVVSDRARLRREVGTLAQQLEAMRVKLVIGGDGVESLAIRAGGHVHTMQSMSELAAFARGALALRNEAEAGAVGTAAP
ncbi:MAG TPA: B12-binding domain-containing protein [Phycisphaerae bacterium]|nr:B12-binding domain-containing protein [Phycisphaerae bacterium]